MGPCVMTRGRPGSVTDGREAKGRSRISPNLRRLLCRTPLLPPALGPSVHSRGAVGLAEGGSLGSSLGFGGHLRYRPRAMGSRVRWAGWPEMGEKLAPHCPEQTRQEARL